MFGTNPWAQPARQPMPHQAGQPMPQQAGLPMPQPAGLPMPQQTYAPSPTVAFPMPMRAPRVEETYVENILRMNRGKVATIYTTNEYNPDWAAKVFKGKVENAARDHVVLSDTETGMRYIIFMVNIDYITFDEPLQFDPAIYRELGQGTLHGQ